MPKLAFPFSFQRPLAASDYFERLGAEQTNRQCLTTQKAGFSCMLVLRQAAPQIQTTGTACKRNQPVIR